jgi:hypothetical protein
MEVHIMQSNSLRLPEILPEYNIEDIDHNTNIRCYKGRGSEFRYESSIA